MRDAGLIQAGIAMMTRLFGRMPERGYIPEDFFNMTVERVYGELWNRPQLAPEERSMVTVVLLAAQGKSFELELHLKGAKRLGLTRERAQELMTQVAFYCGWPTALQGFKSVERVYSGSQN